MDLLELNFLAVPFRLDLGLCLARLQEVIAQCPNVSTVYSACSLWASLRS